MSRPFRAAMLQMHVEPDNRPTNLRHAQDLISEAVANGAELILLPEAMDLGWTDPSCLTQAEPLSGGTTSRMLASAAKRHRVFVCSGLIEQADGKAFNSAILVDRDGRIILIHRKLNELEIAHSYYAQGDRLNVCRTELATFGLMICADAFAPSQVLSRSLCYIGADVILSPNAWAVPHAYDNERQPYGSEWYACYVPVARDFSVWILGVSNVGPIRAGPWAGRSCIGYSLAIGPTGKEAARGPFGVNAEAIIYVDVTPTPRPMRGCGGMPIDQCNGKT